MRWLIGRRDQLPGGTGEFQQRRQKAALPRNNNDANSQQQSDEALLLVINPYHVCGVLQFVTKFRVSFLKRKCVLKLTYDPQYDPVHHGYSRYCSAVLAIIGHAPSRVAMAVRIPYASYHTIHTE